MKLSRASSSIALASLGTLGAQVLLSLVLLRLFAPSIVGEFLVLSQVSFFWATLALAQGPISLLAESERSPSQALRATLVASLWRWLALLPLIAMAVHLTTTVPTSNSLAWAGAMALLQIGWYLAQPLALKRGALPSIVAVRAAPPWLALMIACTIGMLWPQSGATGLLLATCVGYAVGALWLLPALLGSSHDPCEGGRPTPVAQRQGDDRSAMLRLIHTTADAVTGAAIIMVWQRLHGAAEAGYLAILLRLLGFIPTVIHTAWAQVLLAQAASRLRTSLWIGAAGFSAVGAMGLVTAQVILLNWTAPSWSGLLPYLLPLVIWQGTACLTASTSHLAFRLGKARNFSIAAVALCLLQLTVLCMPLLVAIPPSPVTHVWCLATASAAGLTALWLWLRAE